jgi:hypothetical protein
MAIDVLTDAIVVAAGCAGIPIDRTTAAAIAAQLAQYNITPLELRHAITRIAARGDRVSWIAIVRALDDAWPGPEEAWDLARRGKRMPSLALQAMRIAEGTRLRDEELYRTFRRCYDRLVAEALVEGRIRCEWVELEPAAPQLPPPGPSEEDRQEILGALQRLAHRLGRPMPSDEPEQGN